MKFEFVDLFCGAGGTTTGIENAQYQGEKIAYVKYCVDHDKNAIESHLANHNEAVHFIEDIRKLDEHLLVMNNSDAIKCLWASLECTNHNNAKGGMSRDADSRTLGEHLYRYIEYLNPEYIFIENVREFMDWGALVQKTKDGIPVFDKNGKAVMVPDKSRKGEDYNKWVETIKAMGYDYDYRILDSADYGAITSRKRLFIIFSKHGLPVAFPAATHDKKGRNGLKKWNACRPALDLEDRGKSIFREKPLSEKTYKRIYEGLIKFVANGDDSFLQQYNSGSEKHRVLSLDNPVNTIPTNNRFAIVQPQWLLKYNSMNRATAKHIPPSIEDVAPTVCAQNRVGLISTEFFVKYHKTGHNISSTEDPASTLTTQNRLGLIQPEFLDNQYLNPQFEDKGRGLDDPCFTLIAKMDKRPPYLVTTEQGKAYIEIYDNDSEYIKKIKVFMAAYGIVDIYMRMLKIPELLKIQGFPEKYKLIGTQADQKKYIGNAVVPLMAQLLVESVYEAVINWIMEKAA